MRTIKCGKVRGDNDQRWCAFCKHSDDKPSGPPISKLAFGHASIQRCACCASSIVDHSEPRSSSAMIKLCEGTAASNFCPSIFFKASVSYFLPRFGSGISVSTSEKSCGKRLAYSLKALFTHGGAFSPMLIKLNLMR